MRRFAQEECRTLPFYPANTLLQLVARVWIVSWASANITIGVSCFLIYVLEQLGIIAIP